MTKYDRAVSEISQVKKDLAEEKQASFGKSSMI